MGSWWKTVCYTKKGVMEKLPFGELHRTTMAELASVTAAIGVYIFAYMGMIIYVGKSYYDVPQRISGHLTNALAEYECIGAWLRMVEPDWENVRLDILVPPEGEGKYWIQEAEARLINHFKPLFNVHLQPEITNLNYTNLDYTNFDLQAAERPLVDMISP